MMGPIRSDRRRGTPAPLPNSMPSSTRKKTKQAKRTKKAAKKKPQPRLLQPPPPEPEGYFSRSREPLPALLFLLPLILAYELGALFYATPATGRELSARLYLEGFLEWFGAAGDFLPGLAVVLVLLCWHLAKQDRWRFEPMLYLGMGFESLALAMPLVLFGLVMVPDTPVWTLAEAGAGGGGEAMPWQAELVFSIGAGVYEELVFRLAVIALVHMILVDLLKVPTGWGALAAVLVSVALFTAYHFTAVRPFVWPESLPRALFYIVAGIYFAVLYVQRGFGIVAGTHALYDMLIVAIAHGFWPIR
jgi:hypothetical protein